MGDLLSYVNFETLHIVVTFLKPRWFFPTVSTHRQTKHAIKHFQVADCRKDVY